MRSKSQQSEVKSPKSNNKGRFQRREVIFALLAVCLFFVIAEVTLRAIGFSFIPVPTLIDSTWGPDQLEAMNKELRADLSEPGDQQLTNKQARVDLFQPDDLLFWSMKPGVWKDVRQVNDLGLLSPPVTIPKPANTFRVLCLGDSCTVMGPTAYPVVLQRKLKALSTADKHYDVINAGVYSYSSLQGLRLLRDRLGNVQPDLVTVFYGWNDHYLTAGAPDKMLRSRVEPTPQLVRLLRTLRLFQMVQRVVSATQIQMMAERPTQERLRVAPEDYRRNVSEIADLARRRGARLIFLTAPTNHAPGRVPGFLIEYGMAESGLSLVERHRRYNQIVRDVAAAKEVDLLDLDALFDSLNKDELFIADGIHLTLRGRHLVGQLLAEQMARMGVISPVEGVKASERPAYDSIEPNLLRSSIEFLDQPLRAVAGQPFSVHVRVKNVGDTIWLASSPLEAGRVKLAAKVHDPQTRQAAEKERCELPHDVEPGESVELTWTISPIEQPGEYLLEVAPMIYRMAWFVHLGDKQATTSLTIEPPQQPQE
ncbi:SGNH/GDSL hydrolase family protein [Candidatus Sumerlaeota bacterium]|nr:SGNH/GDSL hydrolase family protein [Candidatus Sumerlaeota bacterium]